MRLLGSESEHVAASSRLDIWSPLDVDVQTVNHKPVRCQERSHQVQLVDLLDHPQLDEGPTTWKDI